MKVRMNYRAANPEAFQTMLELAESTGKKLDPVLEELVKIRVSQLNGCAFCVDMHAKDLMKIGDYMEHVFLLPVWKEAPLFTEAQRAALNFAEHAARIADSGMPEEVYGEALRHYGEQGLIDLLMAVNTIGAWNRIAITTGMFPGCLG